MGQWGNPNALSPHNPHANPQAPLLPYSPLPLPLTTLHQACILPGMDTNADQALSELVNSPPPARTPAPTMGKLAKLRYTHEAMIDLIIQNPAISQNQIAAAFGFTPGWISNILASDAFQAQMASRREEIIDPAIKATIEERFKSLVIQSLNILNERLAEPGVSANVAIKAAELGARALGIGAHAPPQPVQPSADRLVILSERLIQLNPYTRRPEVYDGKAEAVSAALPQVGGGAHPPEAGGEKVDPRFTLEGAIRADRDQSSSRS